LDGSKLGSPALASRDMFAGRSLRCLSKRRQLGRMHAHQLRNPTPTL
jgi:hypothetical protein